MLDKLYHAMRLDEDDGYGRTLALVDMLERTLNNIKPGKLKNNQKRIEAIDAIIEILEHEKTK